mmetsp:Transcript_18518/g.27350  ORF Transcript_18518/g.27350 Transcript_18518/m.27350 type:complete len:265 (+) Transcript_18518:540-1334(+)
MQVSVKKPANDSCNGDETFNWAYLIFCGLNADRLVPKLFESLGTTSKFRIVPEQLILLNMFEFSLEQNHFPEPFSKNYPSIKWLANLLENFQFFSEKCAADDESVDGILLDEGFAVILRVLGKVLGHFSCDGAIRSNIAEDMALIKCCFDFLAAKNETCVRSKLDLVKIIANVSFRCKEAQNAVRLLDGIPILLSQCNFDPKNPFLREWAVVAVRNICEGNRENQSFIENIEAKMKTEHLMEEDGDSNKFALNKETGRLQKLSK